MNAGQRYRINQPAVIAEVIDGEAIVVNLDSGAYYSLRGSACAIWELFAAQLTAADVTAAMTARFTGSPAVIEAGVKTLLEELVGEQLLTPAVDAHPVPLPQPANGHAVHPPFEPPMLEKFTDMADLLLLDPIHEVGEMGWPQAAPTR